MSIFRYIFRSLWFFRKQHLALFAGTVVSTAVLTGALIVGDSVKYSLLNLVEVRLGPTRFALQTNDRFVKEDLAGAMGRKLDVPVIALYRAEGVGINPDIDRQVNKLQVLGIDSAFRAFFNVDIPGIAKGEAMVSSNLATKLDLVRGSEMILRVPEAEIIPLSAPFARQAKPSVGLRVRVVAVLGDDQMGRFGLKSNQTAPCNVFVDRNYLAGELGSKGSVNTVLVADSKDMALTAGELDECMQAVWTVADMGLKIKELPDQGKYEIVSDRIFIDMPVTRTLKDLGLDQEKVLTYLVNDIRSDGMKTPYSFVAAASPPYVSPGLGDNEIRINDWLSRDLDVKKGDSVTLTYFVVGPLRKLQEQSHRFIVRDVFETGTGLVDSSLMPEYPGLSEANNCRDWDTGIPIDLGAIRDKDEFYWDDFKGTPKAVINLAAGQSLWQNEFGSITAVRIDKDRMARTDLERSLSSAVNPAELNLFFRPVYEEGIQAATNSVDFGELFLSLSFFVIAAGVLLTVLLYSLQVQARMPEAGLFQALGFTRSRIIRYRIMESAFAIVLGGLAGAGAGVLYNRGLLAGLNSVWQDAVYSYDLDIYVFPDTILTGTLIGVVLAVLSVYLTAARKMKQPISGIIQNVGSAIAKPKRRKVPVNTLAIIAGFGGALVMSLVSLIGTAGTDASLFLGAGGLFMVGCVAGISAVMGRRDRMNTPAVPGILQLSLKNAGRNRARSLFTIALLALGTFTIVITGANRKTFYGAETNNASGTGGYLFWTETTMPVNKDLNTGEGMASLGLEGEPAVEGVSFDQMLMLEGDDASCLNLNQVQQPRILGIDPAEFNRRGSFSFARLKPGIDRDHPWLELTKTYPEHVVPAFADQTVITWGLKKNLGDTLYYMNEQGERIKILLVGGLQNSVFQGNLLIDRQQFRKHFPSVSGSSVMLVDGLTDDAAALKEVMQARMRDYGIEMESTSGRLAAFNAVENTYLTVFMVLGGLGVIIGTIGLGVVLIRNLLDRMSEIALLAAIGFSRRKLYWLVLIENGSLLLAGVIIGVVSALIGILPSLVSPEYSMPGTVMIWLVAAVLVSGLLWILIPAQHAVRKPLVPALRNE